MMDSETCKGTLKIWLIIVSLIQVAKGDSSSHEITNATDFPLTDETQTILHEVTDVSHLNHEDHETQTEAWTHAHSPEVQTEDNKVDHAVLLYANTKDLRKYDLATKRDTRLASNLSRAVVLDYHYAKSVIVWTDSVLQSIFSVPYGSDQTTPKVLAMNVSSYGVAVDWIHDNVYWTDTGKDVIDVARLDGTMRRTLFRDFLDEPRGIVLNPFEGWMFWSDWGDVPKIEKSGMDGTGRKVIVSRGLKWPNGLAIDLPSRRIFWIEAYHENLCSSDFEGDAVKKVISASKSLKLPFSIDVFQEWIFWTEWTSNQESIFKANKLTGQNITEVLDGESTLMGIKIYHSSKQANGINRCGEDGGGCSHLCLPSPQPALLKPAKNYTCACPNGLELQSDGLNCSSAVELHATLLYCNRHDIRKYDLVTKQDSKVFSNLERATVMDYDYAKDIAVWTDTDKKKIYSAPLWKTVWTNRVIAEGVTSYGIAVDWIHSKVYWTDTLNDVIDVAHLNGSMRRTLFQDNLDEPRAIVLNPLEGWMYWSDWGEVPKIERSGMDGSHRRVIVSQGIRWPNGLALDFESRRLFWVDGKTNVLSRVDFDGGNKRTLISSGSILKHPFSLDVYGDWLYWVEWSSGIESVYRANKVDGSSVMKVFDGERTLMGLKVYDGSKQPEGPNRCGDDNGGCSHLCLPAPDVLIEGHANFTCSCPNDMHLQPDNLNCSSIIAPSIDESDKGNSTTEDAPFLICANVLDIRMIDLKTKRDFPLVRGLTRSVAVDYIYANKTVVWTDIREDRICSSPIALSTLVTELVNDCSHPDGLAVDWIHGNMYWTDKGKDAIGVAKLDGSFEKTLFELDLDEPRAIAVDPFEGWMFWTDWGRVPKIERAAMDGSRRGLVINTDIQWPNGVTVDLDQRKIYWADAKTHEICRSNYDGSNRVTVLSSWSLLKQPFSIDIFKDDMYWVEWRSGEECIYKANKFTGRNVTKIVDGTKWKNLMGIRIHHSSKQPPGPNRCGDNNGGCSHLCLPIPLSNDSSSDYSCACPNSLFLDPNGFDCSSTVEITTAAEIFTEISTISWSYENSNESASILYANQKGVRRLDLESMDDTLLAGNFNRTSAIDYHYLKKVAVWTDAFGGKIYSAPLWSGNPVTTLIGKNTTSNGLAVDWIHDHIYWTDNGKHSINVARLDGTMKKTLIEEEIDPRGIVLHPSEGFIFWTNWRWIWKIVRAGMDGTNSKVIVSDSGIGHGLAIDIDLRKIYWANHHVRNAITSVDFDGSNRVIVHHVNPGGLFSIDVFQDWVFWTVSRPGNVDIWRVSKYSGYNPVKVVSRESNLMGIKVYHSSKQPQGNRRCWDADVCSHLCLPTPRQPEVTTNFTCACPDGMLLSPPGVTCVFEAPPVTEQAPSSSSVSTVPSFDTTSVRPSRPVARGNGSAEASDTSLSSGKPEEAGPPIGMIIGLISALALLALIGVFVYHRHYLRRNIGNIIFKNPVYKKHLEDDFCIEKHSGTARKSLEPLTFAETHEIE